MVYLHQRNPDLPVNPRGTSYPHLVIQRQIYQLEGFDMVWRSGFYESYFSVFPSFVSTPSTSQCPSDDRPEPYKNILRSSIYSTSRDTTASGMTHRHTLVVTVYNYLIISLDLCVFHLLWDFGHL